MQHNKYCTLLYFFIDNLNQTLQHLLIILEIHDGGVIVAPGVINILHVHHGKPFAPQKHSGSGRERKKKWWCGIRVV